MREQDIKEYGTLDANTLLVVSRWLTKYNNTTVKQKCIDAMNVAHYLLERHYEENINGKT